MGIPARRRSLGLMTCTSAHSEALSTEAILEWAVSKTLCQWDKRDRPASGGCDCLSRLRPADNTTFPTTEFKLQPQWGDPITT